MKTVTAFALAMVAGVLLGAAPEKEEIPLVDTKTECWVCGKGSTGCDECRFDGNETANRRKACEKLGCVLTDKTKFCSTDPAKTVCNPPN